MISIDYQLIHRSRKRGEGGGEGWRDEAFLLSVRMEIFCASEFCMYMVWQARYLIFRNKHRSCWFPWICCVYSVLPRISQRRG